MVKNKPRFFYGWVIVSVLALSMMLAYATRSSFGVFYVEILKEFKWSSAETAGIYSLSLIVYGLGGIIAGFLLDRLGPRKLFPLAATLVAIGALLCAYSSQIWQLYLAFGIVVAFGQCALGYVPTMTVLNHWFVKRRAMAMGIAMFGLALSFMFSPLTQYLCQVAGWRTAFVVFGIAVFVIVVPITGLFLRHRPQDMGLFPDGAAQATASDLKTQRPDSAIVDRAWTSVEWTLPRAFKTHRLWLLLATATSMGMVVNFPQVHQVAAITNVGYSPMFAVTVLSAYGLINGIGPVGGLISDRLGREVCSSLGVAFVITGSIAALLITGAGIEWAWYISAISYGLGVGLMTPTLAATYGDLFLGKNLGSVIGFVNAGFGAGGALGPYLAGYIYDATKSYTIAFVMIIAAAMCMTGLLWTAAPRKVRLVVGRAPKVSGVT